MANLTRTTRDHDEIRRWAEERGGKPSHVKRTGSGEDVGILRIDFPGYSGEGSLEPIAWEQWFDKFDEQNLALLYEEETAGGQRSNFNKIVSAETAAEAEQKSHGRARGAQAKSRSGASAKKTGAKKAAASKKSATASKTAAKRTAGRSTGATKKAATKKAATKKAATRKAPTKKAAKTAAKTASKGAGAKKAASKTAKKSAAKKTATRKRR